MKPIFNIDDPLDVLDMLDKEDALSKNPAVAVSAFMDGAKGKETFEDFDRFKADFIKAAKSQNEIALNLPVYTAYPAYFPNYVADPASMQPPIKAAIRSKSSYELMVDLTKKVPFMIVDNALYAYNGHYYEFLTDDKAHVIVVENCRNEVAEEGVPSFVSNTLKFVRMEPNLRVKAVEDPDILVFRNGILHISSGIFESLSPKYFVTSFVDCDYVPCEPAHCPVFDAFINHIAGGDPVLMTRIWEALGYYVTTDMLGKCFLLFQGASNSGKSVLGAFMTSLFNEEAAAHIDLFRMGDRFSLGGIVGKRINTSLDLPSGLLSERAVSIIKMLTGGDKVTIEIKYQNPFSYLSTCKLLFATNNAIGLKHEDPVFWKRIRLIPFPFGVPDEQQDKQLPQKFQLEKSSIVKKALGYYLRLRENNYVFSGGNNLAINTQCIPAAALPPDDTTVVRLFVERLCDFVPTEQGGTFTEVLHAAYIQFCQQFGFSAIMDRGTFSEILKRVCGDRILSDKWRDKRFSEGSLRGYKGIVIKGRMVENG